MQLQYLKIFNKNGYILFNNLISKKDLKIISKDHSVVQQLIDKQLILEEEAFSHPRKNELTQALGINEKIEPFIDFNEIENSDLFMICSDGLYNEIVLNNLVEIFKNYSYNLEELNQKLLTTSLENGGNDNISVILFRSGKINIDGARGSAHAKDIIKIIENVLTDNYYIVIKNYQIIN